MDYNPEIADLAFLSTHPTRGEETDTPIADVTGSKVRTAVALSEPEQRLSDVPKR